VRLKPSLSLVLLAALSGTYVIAQQPDGPPSPGKMDQGRGGWGGEYAPDSASDLQACGGTIPI